MKQTASLVFALSSTAAGCSKPKPVVVLDGWWNADFAKNSCVQTNHWQRENADIIARVGCAAVTACPEMMRRFEGCAGDPVQEVREFETELV